MNILTHWLRSYLPELPVDDRQLAEDLTLRGIAVEGEFPAMCGGSRFEMDITTNRVDAMNHYGIAREAAAIYNLPLHPLSETHAGPIAAAPGDPFGHSVTTACPAPTGHPVDCAIANPQLTITIRAQNLRIAKILRKARSHHRLPTDPTQLHRPKHLD